MNKHLRNSLVLLSIVGVSCVQDGRAPLRRSGTESAPSAVSQADSSTARPARHEVALHEGMIDANGNGVDDAIDIVLGTSADNDGNGIPDEVETPDSDR